MTVLAAVAGCLGAVGVIMLVGELRPAPPRLDAALARIQPVPNSPLPVERVSTRDGVGRWLAQHVARPAGLLALPRTDLALLGRSVERFMLDKLTLFITGLLVPPVFSGLVALAGGSPAWMFPVVAGLALGAILWLVPDWNVRSQARQRRRDFRYAFTSYLQLVVLEREAGAALNAALENPAKITEGWPFRRVHEALTRARHGQQQPWRALARLGEEIGVRDLIDLAHTAEIAGSEGAKMHDVLVAKITSMRHEASAAARSEANSRTTAMWVPTSLLMLGFVILVGFPFFSKLLASG
ncbi:type II secretion system protein F (GspF) [Actinomadura pelletieri DSM 43383]|uniref:Type II secretion system protein F (GspF) n=1 Tax=Actinomadura pelletieri DSM 43383 TaxID=1120940 RepID=A0A495Q9Z0_9ACTN|nr:type II secretion system F family protein [Actinomadura pelletieri]RKS68282.1 type II secretion system protein F (GspF) [Actinomadura pelletieri DSM 43383]